MSYCELKNDIINHPNFIARLERWRSSKGGCVLDSGTDVNGCLTDAEAACYASYTLGTKRNELDTSLRTIYQPENAPSASFDSNYNTTMLTGVVWAMLGTTVLYYAFTKM